MRRTVPLYMAVGVLVAATSAPASAASSSDTDRVYESNTYCLDERAYVATGDDRKGYARGDIYSTRSADQALCAELAARPAQQLAQQLLIYFRKSEQADTGLCAKSPRATNPARAYHFAISGRGLRPLCGRGYYMTVALGSLWKGDRWVGGPVASGWIYLK